MPQSRKLTSAFTLVELAIVIVIIGLLVAGVLQGQALIQASKNNKIISEFRGFLAAYITYKDKYNALPGDDAKAGSRLTGCTAELALLFITACNGNGDKSYANVSGYDWGDNPDPGRFWFHLKYANLLSGSQKTSIPQYFFSSIGDSVIWWIYTGPYNPAHAAGPSTARQALKPSTHYITLANHITGISNLVPSLSPVDAFNIDSKFDDGMPLTGKVLGGTGTSPAAECVAGTQYNMASEFKSCVLIFELE